MAEFKWSGDNDGSGGGGGGGSPYFIDPVADVASLPASAPEGTLVLVKDIDALYERRLGVWILFVDPGQLQDDLTAAQSDIDTHVADTNNPHAVTKAQVGLGDVENAAASTLYIPLTQKASPNGVATLDAGGQIPSSQLPALAITETFVVASQAAQTALTAQVGDVAVRSDLNKSYILQTEPASTFSNWVELLTPTDSVLSVNGQTGAVSLTTTNVAEGTNQYFTTERAQDAVFNAIPSSSTVQAVYDDSGNQLFLDVIQSGINITNTAGTLPLSRGGTGQTTKTPAFDALSPNTTKGDLVGHNGTNNVRLPAGVNGQRLQADSSATTGLKWVDPGMNEINLILNPNSAVNWSVLGATVTTDVTTIQFPLYGAVETALKVSAATSGHYTEYAFSVPSALARKMKIELWYKHSGSATDWKVELYKAGVKQTLKTDVSGNSFLTAGTGRFQTDFDFEAASYTLRIVRNASVAMDLYLQAVVVGPGLTAPGYAGGEYESTSSYVIAGSTTAPTTGSGATFYRNTYRDGSYAIIRYEFNQASAGTAGSGDYLLPLPSGLAIDYTRVGPSLPGNGNVGSVGDGLLQANGISFKATAYVSPNGVYANKVGLVIFNDATAIGGWSSALAALSNTPFRLSLTVRVPIVGWDNAVNIGPGAQPTYASNSSTSTASDSTSFAYGEDGALIQAFAPTGTSSVTKRVRSTYTNPKFAVIQVKPANRNWVNAGSSYYHRSVNDAGTQAYGMWLNPVSGSSTDFDVVFQQSVDSISGNTWAAELANGTRWRVVFADTPAAVGFGKANSSETGLVAPRKGQTSLTVTGSMAGWSTVRAVGIYYQDQDGNHRMKFNLSGTYTGKTLNGGDTIAIAGVTFKNLANFEQPCSSFNNGTNPGSYAFTSPGTGTVTVSAVNSTSSSRLGLSGDVELESKPTWA